MPFPRPLRGRSLTKPQAQDRAPLKRLRLNRGDLLLLLCGVLAFFVLTFMPGILTPANVPAASGTRPSAAPHPGSPAPTQLPGSPADTFPWGVRPPVPAGARGLSTSAPPAAKPLPTLPANFPPAAAPTRILYPGAGIDVTIHPLTPSADQLESQAIVPPITEDGYWVENFGMPGVGSTNTTYILGHSWEDRVAPFNRLSSSAPGDTFEAISTAGTMQYRVDSVDTYEKAALKDSPIWAGVPNRIVLISCYTEDLWGKNVVVVASPVLEP